MKLEVFPYCFKGKALAAALYRRGGGTLEVHGAKDLYDLYSKGVSFRPMPGTMFDAVVFDLDDISPDEASRLDSLNMPGAYIAKSPSAILGVPGKLHRRKVFYQLQSSCGYADYANAYRTAFTRFALDSGLPLLKCDQCMSSSRQMTYGRPIPDMDDVVRKVDIPGMSAIRPPLPLSRYTAKALFGIDDQVLLPPLEVHEYRGRAIPEGERHMYIWRNIVPAAFAWYRYFSTTAETRWGLNQAKYSFQDCIAAIRSAMARIGVDYAEIEAVIRGDLYGTYKKFVAPRLSLYNPRGGRKRSSPIVPKRKSRWSKLSTEQKQALYDRQKANRRLVDSFRGTTGAKVGRPSKLNVTSLADLEDLYRKGEISKPYFFKLKKQIGAPPRRRGRPSDA